MAYLENFSRWGFEQKILIEGERRGFSKQIFWRWLSRRFSDISEEIFHLWVGFVLKSLLRKYATGGTCFMGKS